MTNFVKIAAAAVIGMGGMIAFTPVANAGQMMPKLGSMCPSGAMNTGGGYCQAYGNDQYIPKSGNMCPSGFMSAGGNYCKSY